MSSVLSEQLDDWRRRYQASALPGFFAWWGKELNKLVPVSWRQRMMPAAPTLVLVADETGEGHFTVWRLDDTSAQIDQFSADEDGAALRSRWLRLFQGDESFKPRVVMAVPDSLLLDLNIDLPLAVEANLEQALRFQLDQLTPFPADQLAYDHQVTRRDAAAGRVHLRLRLMPTALLEPLQDRLAALGIRPHAIDGFSLSADGLSTQGFNLIPAPKRPRYVYPRKQLNLRLAGALGLLLVVVMVQSLVMRQNAVDGLRSEVAGLRSQADAVLALQREVDEALDAANFLAHQRAEAPVTIQVLDELSRVLPDNFWLQQLQLRGNSMILMGFAEGSQALIELLNDSLLFDNTEFRGRVTVDTNTGEERFNAQSRVLTRGERHAVAARAGE